jgi:hypothetical protein
MTPFVNTEESIQSDAPKTFKNVECPSQFPELLELEKEIFGPLPIEVCIKIHSFSSKRLYSKNKRLKILVQILN